MRLLNAPLLEWLLIRFLSGLLISFWFLLGVTTKISELVHLLESFFGQLIPSIRCIVHLLIIKVRTKSRPESILSFELHLQLLLLLFFETATRIDHPKIKSPERILLGLWLPIELPLIIRSIESLTFKLFRRLSIIVDGLELTTVNSEVVAEL